MRWLPLLLLLATGCNNECRNLCADWFDYQQDVCGQLDLNDERVSCIADYTQRLVGDDELDECATRRDDLADVRGQSDTTARQACCPDGDGTGCPWQASDASAR